MNDKIYKLFDSVKFPLTIGVIFIHCNIFLYYTEQQLSNVEITYKLFNDFHGLLSLCVNTFFFISGFLFFRSGELNIRSYKNKIRTRLSTLFVPYILFNLLFALIRYPYNIIFNGESFNLGEAVLGFIAIPGTYYPHDGPLWYIRDLMCIILLSPIIYFFIRRVKILWLVFLYAVLSFTSIYPMFINAVFFFSFGALFPICGYNLERLINLKKYIYPVFLIFTLGTILLFSNFMDFPSYLWSIYMACATIFSFKICSLINNIPKIFSNSTFFVYAFHTLITHFFISFIMGKGNDYIPENNLQALFLVIILVTSTYFISLLAYKISIKFFPKITRIMCGNRVHKEIQPIKVK